MFLHNRLCLFCENITELQSLQYLSLFDFLANGRKSEFENLFVKHFHSDFSHISESCWHKSQVNARIRWRSVLLKLIVLTRNTKKLSVILCCDQEKFKLCTYSIIVCLVIIKLTKLIVVNMYVCIMML